MKAAIIAALLAVLCVAAFADEAGIPKIPGLSCTLCQNVVKKLEQAANNNVSLSWIQSQVTTICAKYQISDWCNKNVVPLLPQILGWVNKKAPTDKICTAVKLCKNATEEIEADFKIPSPLKPGKHLFPGINCAVCENVVSGLEGSFTSNETLAKLGQDLSTLCNKFGVGKWCDSNLKSKLPSIFYKLKTKADPTTLCKSVKLCRNTTKPKKPVAPQPALAEEDSQKFSVTCEVCQAVITSVKTTVGNNNSQAAIQAALTKACNALPFAKDLCQQILIPYVTQIVQGFVANQDPAQICQKLKLCKAPAQEEEVAEKRATEGNVKCGICTAVLTYVKNFIGTNTSQAAIKKALDAACAKIPFAKDLCTSVIEPYVTQIIEGIVAKEDPAQICQKIKLCAKPAPSVDMSEDEMDA